jgi:serine protease AprX
VKPRLAVEALSAITVLAVTSITIAAPSARTLAFVGAPTTQATADVDGDKIFDDLEARVQTSEPDDKLNVLVQLEKPLTEARFDAVNQAIGGVELTRWLPIVRGFAATVSANQVRALAARPGVAQVELNGVVRAYNFSAQDSFGVTKARADYPALDGNGVDGDPRTYSSTDIVVAVIDTGIAVSHDDLDGVGKVREFVNCLNQPCTIVPPFDDNGHGTHVAGTIAGEGDAAGGSLKGVAPGAALVGVKVLGSNGGGSDAGVIAGIDWAVLHKDDYGIEVLNLSLGANGCHDGTDMTSVAVEEAVTAGLVVVVAAGNDGDSGTCTVGSPGVAENVITVGAMADTGVLAGQSRAELPGFNQAHFSSRGPTLDNRVKPDISAPGVQITSAARSDLDRTMSGTSMAAPFVAGVAALMLDHNPMLTHPQIKSTLMTTAVDWGPPGRDIDYGAGRLDAYAALSALPGSPLNAPPPAPSHAVISGSLPASGAVAVHPVQWTNTGGPPTGFPLSATLIMPEFASGQPDFDLYLRDPNGTLMSLSEFTTRQEEVGAVPITPGTYSLVVVSYEGCGKYLLDVSGATLGPSQPAASPCPLPPPPPEPPPQPPPPQPPPPQPPPPQPPPPPPPPPVRPPTPLVRCVVPNVKRKSTAQARRLLAAKRCALGRVKRTYSARIRKGWIISQSRRPGLRLPRGARVNVVVSRGARRR